MMSLDSWSSFLTCPLSPAQCWVSKLSTIRLLYVVLGVEARIGKGRVRLEGAVPRAWLPSSDGYGPWSEAAEAWSFVRGSYIPASVIALVDFHCPRGCAYAELESQARATASLKTWQQEQKGWHCEPKDREAPCSVPTPVVWKRFDLCLLNTLGQAGKDRCVYKWTFLESRVAPHIHTPLRPALPGRVFLGSPEGLAPPLFLHWSPKH